MAAVPQGGRGHPVGAPGTPGIGDGPLDAALDLAWADYQAMVGASAPRRRESVAAARRTFNSAACAASLDREVALASAAEDYLAALERICSRYEGAVDVAVSAAASAIAGGLDKHPHRSLAAA